MKFMVDKYIFKVDKTFKLAFLLIFLYAPLMFGQTSGLNRYHSRFITDNEGLPFRNVDGIFCDDKGFIWISFFGGGLSRYDGSKYLSFTSETSPMSLSSDYVTESCQDHFDRLWVSTACGIDIIDLQTFKPVQVPERILLSSQKQYCNHIMSDSDGNIWYSILNVVYRASFNEDGSLAYLDSLKCSQTEKDLQLIIKDINDDSIPYTSIDGEIVKIFGKKGIGNLQYSQISGLDIGKGNRLNDIIRKGTQIWVATNNGVFCYDQINETCNQLLHNTSSTSILLSNDGTIIAGTRNGLVLIGANDEIETIKADNDVFGNSRLSGNIVHCLSKIGNQIWVGTEGNGITIIERSRLSLTNIRHNPYQINTLPKNAISRVFIDSFGRCWASSIESGLYLFSRNDYSWKQFDHSTGLSNYSIRAFCEDGRKRIWVGTLNGSLYRINTNSWTSEAIVGDNSNDANKIGVIYDLAYDRINEYVWILSRLGLFYYDIRAEQLYAFPQQYIQCKKACIDDTDNMWLTHSQGISKLDLTNLQSRDFPEYGLCNSASFDSESNLWVGTGKNGLIKLSTSSYYPEIIDKYNINDGLADNSIMGLAPSGNYMWVSTPKGLSRINAISGIIDSFGLSDGLASDDFQLNSICTGKEEEIYLGHLKGISIVWSNHISNQDKERINLQFTRCIVGDDLINLTYNKEVTFYEKENYITVEFTDFTYSTNKNIKYESRIYPLYSQWRTIESGESSIQCDGIPGGKYLVQIRATNLLGETIEGCEDEFSLVVTPYFYKTALFRIFILLLLILCVFWIIEIRTRSLQRKKNAIQKEVDLKTSQLLEQKHQLELQNDQLKEQNRLLLKQNEQIIGHQMVMTNKGITHTKEVRFAEIFTEKVKTLYKDPDLNVDILCREMGMSRSVLNSKVQHAFNQSVGQFVKTFRLKVSKELMSNSSINNMNVSEIAYEVGFNDPKYFSRCFSREFGMAPSDMIEVFRNAETLDMH